MKKRSPNDTRAVPSGRYGRPTDIRSVVLRYHVPSAVIFVDDDGLAGRIARE